MAKRTMLASEKKVERYLERVFESVPDKGFQWGAAPWLMLSFVTFGLGYWSLFGGGPENALKSAHALTWVFICVNAFVLGVMGVASFAHAFIAEKDALAGDRILFTSDYRGNIVSKFVAFVDTPLLLALAIMAGWTFSIFCLGMLLIAELLGKYIHKNNKAERRVELANTSESDLHELFATKEEEEAVGKDIEALFRDS